MPPLDLDRLGPALDAIEAQVWATFDPASPTPQLDALRRRARAAREARAAFKRTLGAALRAFAASLGFELTIPGGHPGGISNQDLFDLLAERGWDWGANTKRLRDHVRVALLAEFDGADAVPLRIEVERVAADAILTWVAARLDGRATDVARPALSDAYRKAKRRRYQIGRAGTASGALRDAVLEKGRVEFE